MGHVSNLPLRRQLCAGLFLVPLLGSLLGPACKAAPGADLLAAARARGTLRVAMEGSYPPFNFVDPQTGRMTGYDADVASLLGARLQLPVDVVTTEWADIFTGLNAGKYDLIVSQVSMTTQREQMFDFSVPYTYSSAQLILRNNDEARYTSLADLKGRTVGVARGSIYEAQVRAVPGIIVRSYPAAPEVLQDLAFGRIDAALNDSLMVAWLVGHSALPIKPGPLVGPRARIAIAIRKGNPELKAAIDTTLHGAQADGSLSRLSRKWFRVDATRPVP